MSCTLAGSPHRRRLLDDVRQRLFTPARPGVPGMGAEVEWIPWDLELERVMPILDDERGRGSFPVLRALGAGQGWIAHRVRGGAPRLVLPGGGRITYEPGGQVEYASPPLDSAASLAGHLAGVAAPLVEAARDRGIALLGRGIDPRTPLQDACLRLAGDRYRAMHRYFSAIGDAGPRMMLQTAAVQVNVELGPDPVRRWRVLNAAAPFLTAIFANSRIYRRRDTGFASFRARQWRLLDRRRTGVLGRGDDPAAEYVDFALNAGWIMAPPDRPAEPFEEWLLRGQVSLQDWHGHLTTLFPEIRPRGFLEVRCIDALEPEWIAAPIVLLAGMLADGRSLGEAAEIVGAPDSELLLDAAREGLGHPGIGDPARELFRAALEAAARTGLAGTPALEAAERFYDGFTARGRAPGDVPIGEAA